MAQGLSASALGGRASGEGHSRMPCGLPHPSSFTFAQFSDHEALSLFSDVGRGHVTPSDVIELRGPVSVGGSQGSGCFSNC